MPWMQGSSVQVLSMSTRAVLCQIENLTYNVTDNEKEILADIREKLADVHSKFYARMPRKEGLIIRPQDQRQIVNIRRRVWKVWKARTVLCACVCILCLCVSMCVWQTSSPY